MALSNENKKRMYDLEKYAVIAVIVLAVLIVSLVLFGTKSTETDGTISGNGMESLVKNDSDASASDSVADNEIGTVDGIQFVTTVVSNTGLTSGDLVLANPENGLFSNIQDDVHVPVSDEFGLTDYSVKLRQEAIEGIEPMLADFFSAKEIDSYYIVTKGYDASDEYSDHATGLGFNIRVSKGSGTIGDGAYDWYYDNCWKYGYVLRYPEGKEIVTGVEAESNHFRYVGVPHALYMYRKGLVLEEYLSDLERQTTYKTPLNLDVGSGDVLYMAYAVQAEEGNTTNIMVPSEDSGWDYYISGTNNGYFIVTISKSVE